MNRRLEWGMTLRRIAVGRRSSGSGTAPIEILVEMHDGLDAGERFSGRGDEYRFDEQGLFATHSVARDGDPSCCPSGGTIEISYELDGDRFSVTRAERSR